MVKKMLLIVITIYFVSFIQSCCTDEYTYKWTGFCVQLIDNSGIEPIISDKGQIHKKAFGLRLSMSDTVYFIAQRFKIIDECYATSCGKEYTRLHNLTSISIKTLNDYSAEFHSGADITPLFKARFATDTKVHYVSIKEMVNLINNADEYNYVRLTPDFDLYLLDENCQGGQQQFEVSLELSDGNVLTGETNVITLY